MGRIHDSAGTPNSITRTRGSSLKVGKDSRFCIDQSVKPSAGTKLQTGVSGALELKACMALKSGRRDSVAHKSGSFSCAPILSDSLR